MKMVGAACPRLTTMTKSAGDSGRAVNCLDGNRKGCGASGRSEAFVVYENSPNKGGRSDWVTALGLAV